MEKYNEHDVDLHISFVALKDIKVPRKLSFKTQFNINKGDSQGEDHLPYLSLFSYVIKHIDQCETTCTNSKQICN